MCAPMLVYGASSVIGALSALHQAGAQAAAAEAQAKAAMYMAEVNERNAQFAERRARDAILRGQEEQERMRREGRQFRGQQMVQLAAANLDLGYGSPLDVLVDTTAGFELDAARAMRNAKLEAEDFDMQAWSARAQRDLHRKEARSAMRGASLARRGGLLGAAGALIGGGASYLNYQTRIAT